MTTDALLTALAGQAVGATVLAVVVTLAGRTLRRRPEVVHVLWLTVLLKLLLPPIFTPAILPSAILPASTDPAPAVPTPGQEAPLSTEVWRTSVPSRLGWTEWLLGAWGLGSVTVLALAFARQRRFRALVERAMPASAEIDGRVATLAMRLGLDRSPEVRISEARISPLVWRPVLGRAELVLPRRLVAGLEARELDAVLVHELAHVRRGDPWVRYLELAAAVAFWWLPVVYWARRRLREAEESCCDAWVGRTLPDSSRRYAEGLLKTLDFLAGGMEPLAIATGMSSTARNLETRLKMILKKKLPRPLSVRERWLVATLALSAVLVFPTWAQSDNATPSSDDEIVEPAMVDAAMEDRIRELEEALRTLQGKLEEIHGEARQARIASELEALELQRDLEDLEKKRREMELEARVAEGQSQALAESLQQRAEQERLLAELREQLDRQRLEMDEERDLHEKEVLERLKHQLDEFEADESVDEPERP